MKPGYVEPSPTPEGQAFRDEVLGPLSSHPDWIRWRHRWGTLLAFVPLGLVLAAMGFLAGDYVHWLSLLRNTLAWLAAVTVTLAFAVGFLMAAALCARAARAGHGHILRIGDLFSSTLEPWVLGTAIILGAVGPYVLSRSPVVPRDLQWLFVCFAVFPLLGVLLGIKLMEGPVDGGSVPATRPGWVAQRRRWLLLLLAAVLALVAITLLEDLAAVLRYRPLYDELARWVPWYASLARPFSSCLVLLPVAFLLFVVWRLWPAQVPAVQPRIAETSSVAPRLPWWKRMLGKLRSFFAPRRAPQGPVQATPPEWVVRLLDAFHYNVTPAPLQLEENETAPASAEDEWKYIFGVCDPTTDQVRVLRSFQDLYQTSLQQGGSNTNPAMEPCADLLVEGDPGVGKTTALMACATYAAFVRGQRVLFIVPDSLRQDAAKAQFSLFLRRLGLHHYLAPGILNEESVKGWLSGQPIPHVLVATIDTVEQYLYGASSLEGQHERLKRLVLLPEVMIVDDFMEFDDPLRSHLPFLLDKHRLLLAAEYLPIQVVVSCRRLSELGERIVATRLFTVKSLDRNRNVLHLRPPRGTRAWRVRLEVDDPAAALDRLVVHCLAEGLDVVLYRSGIDEDERRSLQSDLEARGDAARRKARQQSSSPGIGGEMAEDGQGRIIVMSDLERPLASLGPLTAMEVDAVFYQEALQEDICLALRMHAGNDETVVFSIAKKGMVPRKTTPIVPVVADRSATALLVTHLNSVVRFLRPLSPVSLDAWNKFGIGTSVPWLVKGVEAVNVCLHVDRWEDRSYGADLWPYIVLGDCNEDRNVVHVHGLPDPAWGLYRRRNDCLLIGRQVARPLSLRHAAPRDVAQVEETGRRARWVDADSDFGELGEIDLAHAYRFRLVFGQRNIGLESIEQQDNGSVRLISQVWQGRGADRYLPIYDLGFSLPDCGKPAGFWGGPADGLQWFQLGFLDSETIVRTQIVGQMSDYAEVTSLPPVSYRYPARICGLLFCPREIAATKLEETIAKSARGWWATKGMAAMEPQAGFPANGVGNAIDSPSKVFWPALTAALNFALLTKAPGLFFFARLLAFKLPTDSPLGSAVTWLIEPTSGGRTASKAVLDLLRDPEERREFFRQAASFLNRLGTYADKQRFVRQSVRLGFAGDSDLDDADDAMRLIRTVLGTSVRT